MSFDTTSANKVRRSLQQNSDIWLFGYGSLIYKIDFPYLEKQPAHVFGWSRRFWQGSHDHRGTPENPGRVTTLIPTNESEACDGIALRIEPEVFDHLDHREKNGYLCHSIDIHFGINNTPSGDSVKGFVYIADDRNAAYLGPADELEIAQHIFTAEGPSGKNKEYLYQLSHALESMQSYDEHISKIEKHLKSFEPKK